MSTLTYLFIVLFLAGLYFYAKYTGTKYVDGFTIKGLESAGKVGNFTVKDLFLELKSRFPDRALIPMGGIGHPDQVQWYMHNGAAAVAVGSVLALARESPLHTDVKEKIIKQNLEHLRCLSDSNQNCIVFDEPPSLDTDQSWNWNRDELLHTGINTGKGHVYMGHGIQYVDHIRSVSDIIKFLVSKL